LPEVVVDDFSANPQAILRPLFNMVWNAYGYPRAFSYDESGKWTGIR
jgi:hypothetical protein